MGLSTQKSSSQDTRLADMMGYVMATERTKPFATVAAPGYVSVPYYFDLQGNTNAPSASYLQATVSNVSGVGSNAALLGIGNGNTNLAPMRAVFIYPLPRRPRPMSSISNRSNE
ncbi:MAG: hypothetical protein WDO13_01760 [Verrucomicrobiota bacterium]